MSKSRLSTPSVPSSELECLALVVWPALQRLVPLSRAQVWEMERRGEFPKRVQISARRVAWRAGDIRDWLASRKVIEPDTPVSHLLGWPEGVNHRTTVAAATQVSA